MNVLIAESDPALGALWQRHLERRGMIVRLVTGQETAAMALSAQRFDVIILNILLNEGSALAVADLASYRHPETQVIFVTNTSFFSDGSIFGLSPNACAYVQTDTPPDDLVAMVEHYGRAAV